MKRLSSRCGWIGSGTCFAVAKKLLANKGLNDDSYAAAEKTFGLKPCVTVGSFSMTCLTAATFQVDPPPKNPIPLAEWCVARMELATKRQNAKRESNCLW